jgi:3D (Asp-Asp-Asp) domain-containing protein
MNPLALIGAFLLTSGGPVAPVAIVTPAVPPPTYEVKLTAYNAVAAQTDANPFVTAAGVFSNPEVVAARSQDLAGVLPFGTIISIEASATSTADCGFDAVSDQVGYRVIADTMAARKTDQVDVLLDQDQTVRSKGIETNPSLVLGVCDGVTIRVVGHVDLKDIPKTQADLARLVTGDTSKLAIK